ncbi:MAG: hypothetical protein ACI4EJ_10460 [Bacteroides sp.]
MKKLEKYLSGENLDTYKRKRETWILSSIVSIFFPFIISIVINAVSGELKFLAIFKQGDIIILFYSLTIAVLFDLWNLPKDSKKNDRGLQRCFYAILMVLFSQMSLYGVIKANIITDLLVLFLMTLGTIIASYYACNSTLLQIFLYNIEEVK